MPARPSPTASTEESASCQLLGSATASVPATGSSQFVTGCQNGANWIQPPITASTARIPTGTSIVRGPSGVRLREAVSDTAFDPKTMKYRRNV